MTSRPRKHRPHVSESGLRRGVYACVAGPLSAMRTRSPKPPASLLRRCAPITASSGIERCTPRVMAGADAPSTICDADYGEVGGGGPALNMMGLADLPPVGPVIVARRL